MAKTPSNAGKPWTNTDLKQLKQEVTHNTPTRIIALHMGRTPESIYAKASAEKISLKPTNQSPYGTKKGS